MESVQCKDIYLKMKAVVVRSMIFAINARKQHKQLGTLSVLSYKFLTSLANSHAPE